jgi:hypothetical protein
MRMAFCISHTAVKILLGTYMLLATRWLNGRSLYRSSSICLLFLLWS